MPFFKTPFQTHRKANPLHTRNHQRRPHRRTRFSVASKLRFSVVSELFRSTRGSGRPRSTVRHLLCRRPKCSDKRSASLFAFCRDTVTCMQVWSAKQATTERSCRVGEDERKDRPTPFFLNPRKSYRRRKVDRSRCVLPS